jgi:hypothetical protein
MNASIFLIKYFFFQRSKKKSVSISKRSPLLVAVVATVFCYHPMLLNEKIKQLMSWVQANQRLPRLRIRILNDKSQAIKQQQITEMHMAAIFAHVCFDMENHKDQSCFLVIAELMSFVHVKHPDDLLSQLVEFVEHKKRIPKKNVEDEKKMYTCYCHVRDGQFLQRIVEVRKLIRLLGGKTERVFNESVLKKIASCVMDDTCSCQLTSSFLIPSIPPALTTTIKSHCAMTSLCSPVVEEPLVANKEVIEQDHENDKDNGQQEQQEQEREDKMVVDTNVQMQMQIQMDKVVEDRKRSDALDGSAVSEMFEEHRLAERDAEPIIDRMDVSYSDTDLNKHQNGIVDACETKPLSKKVQHLTNILVHNQKISFDSELRRDMLIRSSIKDSRSASRCLKNISETHDRLRYSDKDGYDDDDDDDENSEDNKKKQQEKEDRYIQSKKNKQRHDDQNGYRNRIRGRPCFYSNSFWKRKQFLESLSTISPTTSSPSSSASVTVLTTSHVIPMAQSSQSHVQFSSSVLLSEPQTPSPLIVSTTSKQLVHHHFVMGPFGLESDDLYRKNDQSSLRSDFQYRTPAIRSSDQRSDVQHNAIAMHRSDVQHNAIAMRRSDLLSDLQQKQKTDNIQKQPEQLSPMPVKKQRRGPSSKHKLKHILVIPTNSVSTTTTKNAGEQVMDSSTKFATTTTTINTAAMNNNTFVHPSSILVSPPSSIHQQHYQRGKFGEPLSKRPCTTYTTWISTFTPRMTSTPATTPTTTSKLLLTNMASSVSVPTIVNPTGGETMGASSRDDAEENSSGDETPAFVTTDTDDDNDDNN